MAFGEKMYTAILPVWIATMSKRNNAVFEFYLDLE